MRRDEHGPQAPILPAGLEICASPGRSAPRKPIELRSGLSRGRPVSCVAGGAAADLTEIIANSRCTAGCMLQLVSAPAPGSPQPARR